MTVFRDLFEDAGLPAIMDQHGESIVYRWADNRAKTITAVVDRQADRRGESAERGRQPIEVVVQDSDVESVTEHADMVEVDGKTYTVEEDDLHSAGRRRLYCI